MKYGVVNQSIEEFVMTNWRTGAPLQPRTAIAFENVPFNSELYEEWIELRVLFGDSKKVSIFSKEYRVVGLLLIDVKIKPATGVVRGLSLANSAAEMMVSQKVLPESPLVAPTIYFMTPELYKPTEPGLEGLKYQVSCPFYYDVNLEP